MSSKRLKFNIESIQAMSSKIETLAEDLEKLDNELQSKMEQLKSDWQTPAGEIFFIRQDTSWKEEVQKYISTLKTLQEMLDYAVQQYSVVEEAANQLKISI